MIISLLAFIVVFTLVVLVHELGHFIAARASGVKVYEFSIGFPFSPRMLTLFRLRETEFTVRLLPLGGFVSFSREGDEEARALFAAPRFRRAMILAAGSLFNILFAFIVLIPVLAIGKHLSLTDASVLSIKMLGEMFSGTVVLFYKLISGSGTAEVLSGPVGIAAMAGKAAAKGFLHLMYFGAMLSASLGIINLLPLPALDGGQLVMLGLEAVRRKPLNLKTYQVVTMLGMALFAILTIFVTYRDIARLIA